MAALEAAAKDIQEKEGGSREKAFSLAMQRNPGLYRRYLAEQEALKKAR